jgi:leader peptidase (prepilin peptidase)/N-methyltransferase
MVLAFWLIFLFVTGASVGSFLNVAIARLPYEKSLLWPNSRCGACLQSIQWYDNLPILSYLWLRGRCRMCGQSYSPVYMLVELGAALGFVGLFWLDIVENVHGWPGHRGHQFNLFFFPWGSFAGYAWHAMLFSFLLAASVCDMKSREIPLQLTLTGTLVGLIGATLMPWPWPHEVGLILPPAVPIPPGDEFMDPRVVINHGIYAWPFWGPLPSWAGPGGLETGLATGIAGALVGTFLLRAIGFIFSAGLGKEALGLGDADLMMMAGAFLGWQIVVVAFFLSVLPALVFGIMQLIVNRDNSLPFGPSLALSVMVTLLAWQPIGEHVRPIMFWGEVLILLVVLCGGTMFLMSLVFRLLRGPSEEVVK